MRNARRAPGHLDIMMKAVQDSRVRNNHWLIAGCVMLFFGVAVVASPAMAVHQAFGHVQHHHHHGDREASHAERPCFDGSQHSHADHQHAILQSASSRAQYRSDLRTDVAVNVVAFGSPRFAATDRGAARAQTSQRPHPRDPLSLSHVLRF